MVPRMIIIIAITLWIIIFFGDWIVIALTIVDIAGSPTPVALTLAPRLARTQPLDLLPQSNRAKSVG